MMDAPAADGIVYVGCVRASRLAVAGTRSYYRVTVAFSAWRFITSLGSWDTSFTAVLQQLGQGLQEASGDAVALVDPVPSTVASDSAPVTVDVFTLGNASKQTVGDMLDAFQSCAPVSVSRVEVISASAAHSSQRAVTRDDVSQQQAQQDVANSPLTQITNSAEKIVLVVVAVCVLWGLSLILPKRQ